MLITGCSTGIGRATAERLAAAGRTVYATARRPETLAELEARGCRTLALDVTDEASMRAAVAAVEGEQGAVGVLVNNAGYSQSGAIETVPMDEGARAVRDQRVRARAHVPARAARDARQRGGRIVNLSSMGGQLVFPGGGFYHATKYAVEAISDALRFEVKGFGIDVVLIEPGLIRTEFGETAAAGVTEAGAGEGDYARLQRPRRRRRPRASTSPAARSRGSAAPPEAVAKVIEKALTAKRPARPLHGHALGEGADGQRALLPDRGVGRRHAHRSSPPPADERRRAASADRARREGRLGIDTEFMPEGRYQPLLCLVQIIVGGEIVVLDPLAGFDPAPLADVLADEGVRDRAPRRPPGRRDPPPRVADRRHERVRHPGRRRLRGLRGAGRLHRAAARRAARSASPRPRASRAGTSGR